MTSMKTLWGCLGMVSELDRSGNPADDADEDARQGDTEPYFTNRHLSVHTAANGWLHEQPCTVNAQYSTAQRSRPGAQRLRDTCLAVLELELHRVYQVLQSASRLSGLHRLLALPQCGQEPGGPMTIGQHVVNYLLRHSVEGCTAASRHGDSRLGQ